MSDPEFIDPSQIPPEPIRRETLDAVLLQQIGMVYEVLGPFFNLTLEEFESELLRSETPEQDVAIWAAIMVVWIDYHEKYLGDVIMSDADERKLVAALVTISTGEEDPAMLGVPAAIGRRLLDCYEKLEAELEGDPDQFGEGGEGE